MNIEHRLANNYKVYQRKRNLCCQIHVKKRYWKGYWFDIYLELKKEKILFTVYDVQNPIKYFCGFYQFFRLFFLCTQLGWHLYIIYISENSLSIEDIEKPLGNKFIYPFYQFFFFRFYYIDNKVIIINLMNHSLYVLIFPLPAIMTSICNIN